MNKELSKEEIDKAFINNNYGKLSQQKIMKELHISNKKLIKYAKELGIYKPKEKTIEFDDNKIEFIKKNYKKMGAENLAKHFNCSESVIYKYAKKMNKTRTCNIWTKEEDELIKNYYTSSTQYQIKRIFKEHNFERTYKAIEGRAKKLKIKKDITFEGEYLISLDIMDIMNFSKPKINSLYNRNILKFELFRNKRRVSIDSFINFLKENLHLWDSKECDLDYIKSICINVSILVNDNNSGEKDVFNLPTWLVNKIEMDKNWSITNKKPWMYKEEKELDNLLKKGYSISEIAKKLERSYISVYDKYSRVYLKDKKVQAS